MKLKYMHPMLVQQPDLVQVDIYNGEKFVGEKTTRRWNPPPPPVKLSKEKRKEKEFKRRMGKGSEIIGKE
jgi:hypothetical protein